MFAIRYKFTKNNVAFIRIKCSMGTILEAHFRANFDANTADESCFALLSM